MGVDTNTYVGPYAEVWVEVKNLPIDRCKKPNNCPNSQSDFCSECGLETKNRFFTTMAEDPNVDTYGLLQDALSTTTNSDVVYFKDKNVRYYKFIPNKTRGKPERTMYIHSKELNEDWSNIDIKKELLWFETAFAPEIELLKKAYGNIRIAWGLLQWYN